MEDVNKNLKSLRTRKPWGKPLPNSASFASLASAAFDDNDTLTLMPYTQADMLREFYPSSHKINDPHLFPDIYYSSEDQDPVTGNVEKKFYCKRIPRKAFAFQQIIATKRTMHLTGNDIQFENVDEGSDSSMAFERFRKGWSQKSMDLVIGAAIYASMVVADSALAFYMEGGEIKTRVLSFMDGDVLYPHFKRDGKTLSLFVRCFATYDDEGDELANYMEIWDENTYYVFRKKGKKQLNVIQNIIRSAKLALFNLEDYDCIENHAHGFGRVPIAYHRRNDGPAWIFSQDTIEAYEVAKSQMAQNNEEYGEPAIVVTTEDEAISTMRDVRGTIREYHVGTNDKIQMLQAQSAADSYMKECDDDLKQIYRQSFCVDTPEMKSGDLPAQALKIMYSLAFEKASVEALEYQPFVEQCVKLFAIGYGIEAEQTLAFKTLLSHIRYWIEPYVHESTSSVVADLANGVQNKFISRKTACERLSGIYTTPGEFEQIQSEEHQADQSDLLNQIKLLKAQRQANNSNNSQ